MNAPSAIFLHIFNTEMLKNYGIESRFDPRHLATELLKVVRVSYLLARDRLFMPTIDLVESPHLLFAMPVLMPLIQCGEIIFIGSEMTPENFLRHKRRHFARTGLYPPYFEDSIAVRLASTSTSWVRRLEPTTQDLSRRWKNSVEEAAETENSVTTTWKRGLQAKLWAVAAQDRPSKGRVLDSLHKLPDRLDGDAFLWTIVEMRSLLANAHQLRTLASHLLGLEWLKSHAEEFNAQVLNPVPPLNDFDCGLRFENPEKVLHYPSMLEALRRYHLAGPILSLPFEFLSELKTTELFVAFRQKVWIPKYMSLSTGEFSGDNLQIENRIATSRSLSLRPTSQSRAPTVVLREILRLMESIIAAGMPTVRNGTNNLLSKIGDQSMYAQPRIFLVHGWNSVMKNEVVVFLGTELGLSLQVMELEAMRGRTLPEKFEELARAASFAVVIVTADEKIVTEQGDSIWRIRPNILVELGFFWGLLGRERLAILVERPTETEIPTDLSGIGYLSLENGFSGIKFNLLQELKGAGIVP